MDGEKKEKGGMPAMVVSNDEMMESRPEVIQIRQHNEALTYIRKQNCQMLAKLKGLLGENIRLNGILNGINAEIARLKNVVATPKPKFQLRDTLPSLIILSICMLLYLFTKSAAIALIGLAIAVVVPVVRMVMANQKWKKLVENAKKALAEEESKAARVKKQIDDNWQTQVAPYISEIVPDHFPAVYAQNHEMVSAMLDAMENLRANTITEAINLCEEMMFRAGVQASLLRMESSLRDAARSAARSAAAAEASAARMAAIESNTASMAASASRVASAAESAASAQEEAARAVRDRANRD